MNDLFEMQGQQGQENERLSRMDRRELAARQKRAAKRRRASLIATLVAVLVIGVVIVGAWNVGSKFFEGLNPFGSGSSSNEPNDYTGTGKEAVDVTVNPGDGGSAIAGTLVAQGVIKSAQAYTNAALANEDSTKIQPGTYRLYKEIPAAQAIEMLLDLENLAGNRIQVIPGRLVVDVVQDIKKVTGFTDEQIQAAMEDTEARGLPEVANGSYEGWLADGDYRFGTDVTPEEIIEEMVQRSVKRLDKLEVPQEDRQELLKVASIVQSEGKTKHFADVASVIYNRLDAGMRLEMDSTVHYKFGRRGDATTTKDERDDDNPWNTYLHEGLPQTPISSPSEAAIEAALKPNKTNYMFFVTVDPTSGETKFAATYNEHLVNVEEFRSWLRENSETED